MADLKISSGSVTDVSPLDSTMYLAAYDPANPSIATKAALPQDLNTTDSPEFASVKVSDTDVSHTLAIACNSNLTADRTLNVVSGDSDRTITLSGNPTLDDWFNQAVKTTSTVTFADITISNLTATELVATDGSSGLQSLAVATYPSLSELAYLKGADQTLTTTSEVDFASCTLSGNIGAGGAVSAYPADINGILRARSNTDPYSSEAIGIIFGRFGRDTTADRHHRVLTKLSDTATGNYLTFAIDDGTTSDGTSRLSTLKMTGEDNRLLVKTMIGADTTPINKLDVSGGMVVGSSYAGTETADTNGLLVEGIVRTKASGMSAVFGDSSNADYYIRFRDNTGAGVEIGYTDSMGAGLLLKSGSGKPMFFRVDETTEFTAVSTWDMRINTQHHLQLNNGSFFEASVLAGITASSTQTQGQGALTNMINQISTVATTNDTCTLPSARPGFSCVVINNGANTMQLFPASGDNLGAGVDTATTIAAGTTVKYEAYDSTNWVAV